jgi:F-type H+-transporting ATPase subunit a
LAPIELLGVFIKPFSLNSIVYANIWSHRFDEYHRFNVYFQELVGKHTIIWLSFALSILEILVAFLQAYIFTLLSALYFGAAVKPPPRGDTSNQVVWCNYMLWV